MKVSELKGNHKVYRGEMSETYFAVNETANLVDSVIAWVLVGGVFLASVVSFAASVFSITQGFSAFWLMRVCNDLCGVSIGFLVFIFWYSLTHYDHRVRNLMTKKTRFTPNGIMR